MAYRSGFFCALAAAAMLASIPASAQDDEGSYDDGGSAAATSGGQDKRLYFAPLFSYTLADSDRGTKDGLGASIAVGRRFASGLNLELTGYFSSMDADVEGADGSTKLNGFGIAAMVFPKPEYPNLYALLALHQGFGEDLPTARGATVTPVDYKATVFDAGVGYLWPVDLTGIGLAEGTQLRAEARYRMDAHWRTGIGTPGGDKEFYDGVFNIGLQIPLGNLPPPPAEPAPEPPAVVPAAPADVDTDAVPDDLDQCPATPAGAIVDEKGCELDEDADGVVDRLDKCPATAAGTQVNEEGCPLEAAPEPEPAPVPAPAAEEPACREPAPGEPVTLEGCASGDAIVLRGVNFEFNSNKLTANAKVILDQLADALMAAPAIIVEIGGHTDSLGSDVYNQKLSEKRAIAVYDYLASRGVDNKRLTFKGYGESQPIASNETEDGRELNRRVEMRVIGE
ncbi:MAG: OmpA family protein [Gammaproteobacteria bacterium]|nr:OmpA family protein [Gammaproteobacteria bacterium]